MKCTLFVRLIGILSILSFYTGCLFAQSNDHIFPATGKAVAFSHFDQKGFIINGKRTYIVSAGIEYARVPHQLWRDRLLRLKRAGFNCVEIYTFWNFHEPQEGQFDFEGDHDLDAFLKLVRELKMYAIVRVGPYYCAEWDSGGYPLWLRFKDSVAVRRHNHAFEKYVARFFDKLLPVVVANQIHHGGSVILVQLENEHPDGWGTYMPDKYFQFLRDEAVSAGIEVPYFFSGLHHATDPAGKHISFDDPARPNPWFSTEYWSMWYNYYGNTQSDADLYGRRTWKIIAGGSGGYNVYMAHGGTNFAYTNNDEDAASYDYGAAVGQAGDLRKTYYQFKRNAYFVRSFEAILTDSRDGGEDTVLVSNRSLQVHTRRSGKGNVVFIDNRSDKPAATHLVLDGRQRPSGKGLELAPGEIVPVVSNYTLFNNVVMDFAVTRVLGLQWHTGNAVTLVVYGKEGATGAIRFTTRGMAKRMEGSESAFAISAGKVELRFSFDKTPKAYSFSCGKKLVRVVALTDELADRTWFVSAARQNYVISGPGYVGDVHDTGDAILLHTEQYWTGMDSYPVSVYGDKVYAAPHPVAPKTTGDLTVQGWSYKPAADAAMIETTDSNWMKSATALEMGADGDLTANAWYRTWATIADTGMYTVKISKGGDRVSLFVDGKKQAAANIREDDLTVRLQPGKHLFAFFVSHDGRDKLFNYMGALNKVAAKGLSGEVIIKKGLPVYLREWKMTMTGKGDTITPPATFGNAVLYRYGKDAFSGKKGYAWFQAHLILPDGRMPDGLQFKSVDDNAIVFINGVKVTSHQGYNIPFSVLVKDHWRVGENIVSVFIENTDGGGGIDQAVEVVFRDQQELKLNNWAMKGGPGNFSDQLGWLPADQQLKIDGPVFFKSSFTFDSNPSIQAMYRVTLTGLGHGSVWVNGHNLGRYPEKINVDGMYIPECWLKKGLNEVVIFDEDGKTPQSVRIQPEHAASRNLSVLKIKK